MNIRDGVAVFRNFIKEKKYFKSIFFKKSFKIRLLKIKNIVSDKETEC